VFAVELGDDFNGQSVADKGVLGHPLLGVAVPDRRGFGVIHRAVPPLREPGSCAVLAQQGRRCAVHALHHCLQAVLARGFACERSASYRKGFRADARGGEAQEFPAATALAFVARQHIPHLVGREVAGRGNHILGCAILQRCTPVAAATQAQPESHLGYSLPSWTAPTASMLSAASTASRKARPASNTAFFRVAHSKATASRWSLSVIVYSPPSTVLRPWGSDTRPA